MKAIILGSDLLEYNNDVKILEINTNTTIYNPGAELLEYDGLFDMLVQNNISEFHFIYTERDSHSPSNERYRFKEKLVQKCNENNISFNEYIVPFNSVTVPYIEDSPTKFILRQSYDTTALIDDSYCADKFGFCELMSGSQYIPKTYFSSSEVSMDTLNNVSFQTNGTPNVIVKAQAPSYDTALYPSIYSLESQSQLDSLKSSNTSEYLIQEFLYSTDNLVDNKYSIIRSIDVIYGSNLEVISMGGYKQSTVIPIDFIANEFTADRKLIQKSRQKYITKEVGVNQKIESYHTDMDSKIINYTGSIINASDLQIGDYIRSIDFVDYNDNHAANFEEGKLNVFGWSGSLSKSNETLLQTSSSLQGIISSSIDTIYIRVTTADGKSWVDSPSCTYYIEESGSTSTRFEKLNQMYIGDKLVVTDSNTQQLSTLEITNLEMEHAQMMVYGLDFEPSDLFLVDIGDDVFSVMHNACWCPWSYCGNYCYDNACSGCGGGGSPPKL
jgi:hypothetical protein